MPSAIELFSGCGGLSTGLIAAGFEVLSAVEINQTAADTYGLNHPTVNLIVDEQSKNSMRFRLNLRGLTYLRALGSFQY